MKYTIIVLVAFVLIIGGYYLMKDNDPIATVPTNTVSNSTINVSPVGNVLDLSNRGLTKVPAYVFDLTYLESLDLSLNNIDGSLQAEVRHLSKLKVLNLSSNKFTGVPAEIGQLKDLEVLNLSNNLLTGLPNELGNLPKLKVLNLSGNNYSDADLAVIRKSLPTTTTIITK